MTGDVLSNIDEISISENKVEIKGWVLGRPRIDRLSFSIPSLPSLKRPLETYGLASPDVARSLGPDGAGVRFHEIIPYPRSVSVRELVGAQIVIERSANQDRCISICKAALAIRTDVRKSFCDLSLGIGVASYNRWPILSHTLEKIQRHTRLPHHLVVADDGSSDDTQRNLAEREIASVGSTNRGIAWNKNRLLFYLSTIRRCDVVLVLEDDTFPDKDGWETEWVLAALAYGHINYAAPWLKAASTGGAGKWHNPFVLRDKVSGQCAAFSSEALAWVGFLDTRFGRYGHEHVEHTLRMIRAGYGGYLLEPPTRSSCFYALDGQVSVSETASHGTPQVISENGRVFEEIWNESIYRPAWRTDSELELLRTEVSLIQERSPLRRRRKIAEHKGFAKRQAIDPSDGYRLGRHPERRKRVRSSPLDLLNGKTPLFLVRSHHKTLLFYDWKHHCLRHRSEGEAPRNLLLRFDGNFGYFYALNELPGTAHPISPERAGTNERGSHTVLRVMILDHGKVAMMLGQNFMCCEPHQSCPVFDRTILSDWETFELQLVDAPNDRSIVRSGNLESEPPRPTQLENALTGC